MQQFNEFLIYIDQFLGSAFYFVPLLIGTGLFFTLYLRFPQIRYFNFALKVVRGKFDKKDDEGDTSHFKATPAIFPVPTVPERAVVSA